MATVKAAASEFLANRRIAVTGVSRTPATHGSNAVYRRLPADVRPHRRLRAQGDALRVHPHRQGPQAGVRPDAADVRYATGGGGHDNHDRQGG